MNFLGLLGLLALPLIYLLHLLRERERRHTVSSLELWAWLEPEVRGAAPRRVPWNRLLALHLLAAFGLTLAIVNPPLPLPVPPLRAKRIILILDTTSSMGAVDVTPSRLAEAQARAAARLAALGGQDSAVLIGLGPAAQRVSDSAQSGLAALASALAQLDAAGVGHDWAGALALASASIVPGQDNRIVIFTDGAFQLPESLSLTLPAPVEWNLIGKPQPNQAVLGLAARPAASGAHQVFARVANFGDESAQRALTLLADGQPLDTSRLSLAASGTVSLAWTLPPGARTVEVRLSSGDDFPADDQAALGLSNPPIDALLVSAQSVEAADRCLPSEGPDRTAIERALCALPGLQLRTSSPTTYVAYEPHDLYVFQGWLPEAWPLGSVLVLDPPTGSALLPIRSPELTATVPITAPLVTEPLLTDVNFENVTFGQALLLEASDWLSPVLVRDGAAFIWRGVPTHNSTRVVALTFNLAESNITKRDAFPILIANTARELLPTPLPASVRPGEAVPLPSANLFPLLTLTDPRGGTQAFGADRPAQLAGVARPGLYTLEGRAPDGQLKTFGFGVNAGSPDESDLRLQRTAPAFQVGAAPVVANPLTGNLPFAGLWPLFVLLGLALLLVEAFLTWR
ncbi:MAG: VWA domain-containing protein [Anaerolineales bacterium]